MRVVVTGAAGQLGTDLCQVLEQDPRALAWQGLTRAELDVTNAAQVRAVLRDQARPAKIQGGLVVINTAAWTDVDGAEERRGRRVRAERLARPRCLPPAAPR